MHKRKRSQSAIRIIIIIPNGAKGSEGVTPYMALAAIFNSNH